MIKFCNLHDEKHQVSCIIVIVGQFGRIFHLKRSHFGRIFVLKVVVFWSYFGGNGVILSSGHTASLHSP